MDRKAAYYSIFENCPDHLLDESMENDQLNDRSAIYESGIVYRYQEELTSLLETEETFLYAYEMKSMSQREVTVKSILARFKIEEYDILIVATTDIFGAFAENVVINVREPNPEEPLAFQRRDWDEYPKSTQQIIQHCQKQVIESICRLSTYRLPHLTGMFASAITIK